MLPWWDVATGYDLKEVQVGLVCSSLKYSKHHLLGLLCRVPMFLQPLPSSGCKLGGGGWGYGQMPGWTQHSLWFDWSHL